MTSVSDGSHSPPLWHGLAAGGCAALVSRVFTYPPDTVKARLQIQEGGPNRLNYKGTFDAFVKISEAEGVRGFYRGFGALLLTVVPANMCYFSGYELGKRITPRQWGVGSDVVTAVFAQALAGVAYCPIDIVKQTVQTANVTSPQKAISPLQAATSIWRTQGTRGFYRGFLAMNALWMPWNLIYLTMYEASKRQAYEWKLLDMKNKGIVHSSRHYLGGDQEVISAQSHAEVLPPWIYPVCSSTCAAIAAILTHPIDVVKTRIQVTSALTGRPQKAGDITRELWNKHGPSGFSKGMTARVMTMCVGTSISWFMYEMVKGNLNSRFK